MNNKILINVYIPYINEFYELFIPCNYNVKTIIYLINNSINFLTDGEFPINKLSIMINRDNTHIYNNELLIKNTNIVNGARLIIM